ncbi:MAG TPA: hypothetical protein ENO01_00600 [Candidatus Marinimicrobia bacterium]|nr:hypothetical protein [Candidatus Neomarinimicrobiota bacterium]
MDCYSISNILSDYLENNLKLHQRHEAEEHLHNCPACRQKAEEMDKLLQAMHRMPVIKASDSFDAVLMKRIHDQNESVHKFRYFWGYMSDHGRTLSAAAVVLLVLTGSMIVWRGYNPRLDQPLPMANTSPVLSTMGSSSSRTLPSTSAGSGYNQPVSSSIAKKDTISKQNTKEPDATQNRDFRGQIKLVNDPR